MPVIGVELSRQSVAMLKELAKCGVYGQSESEVAARMIDACLTGFIDPPKFESPLARAAREKRRQSGLLAGYADRPTYIELEDEPTK